MILVIIGLGKKCLRILEHKLKKFFFHILNKFSKPNMCHFVRPLFAILEVKPKSSLCRTSVISGRKRAVLDFYRAFLKSCLLYRDRNKIRIKRWMHKKFPVKLSQFLTGRQRCERSSVVTMIFCDFLNHHTVIFLTTLLCTHLRRKILHKFFHKCPYRVVGMETTLRNYRGESHYFKN